MVSFLPSERGEGLKESEVGRYERDDVESGRRRIVVLQLLFNITGRTLLVHTRTSPKNPVWVSLV